MKPNEIYDQAKLHVPLSELPAVISDCEPDTRRLVQAALLELHRDVVGRLVIVEESIPHELADATH